MPFRVEWTDDAVEDFDALQRKIQLQIQRRVDSLEKTPTPPGSKKLRGHESLYRIRSGEYRILYEWAAASDLITVSRIGYRDGFYRGY